MASISLALGSHDKYGLVIVKNPDGSFNRNFRVSRAELLRVQQSKNSWPTGVTQQEWQSGRVALIGKGHDVGDVTESNGYLKIKHAEVIAADGRIVESWMVVPPGQWSGVPPAITIAAAKLSSVSCVVVTPNARPSIDTSQPIVSVANGVVVIK